jgi:hypothetical protein
VIHEGSMFLQFDTLYLVSGVVEETHRDGGCVFGVKRKVDTLRTEFCTQRIRAPRQAFSRHFGWLISTGSTL